MRAGALGPGPSAVANPPLPSHFCPFRSDGKTTLLSRRQREMTAAGDSSRPPHWTFLIEPGAHSSVSIPLPSELPAGAAPATDGRIDTVTTAFDDLLNLLPPPRRRGMVSWLAARYYNGYQPGRPEIADLVALELGALTVDQTIVRQQERERLGPDAVSDIIPAVRALPRRPGLSPHSVKGRLP